MSEDTSRGRRRPKGGSSGDRYDSNSSRGGGSSQRQSNNRGRNEGPGDPSRARKRDRFQQGKKSNANRYLVIGAVIVALLGGYLWYSGNSTGSGASASSSPGTGQRRSSGVFTDVVAQDGVISMPVSNFADGKAKFFTYKGNGKEIDFFVMKSNDGVIRAAIDSCDVCYSYKKGYHQEGDEMVCNNCGQRFPSNKINIITGGCNPVALTRTTQGDNVIINESDILKDNNNLYF